MSRELTNGAQGWRYAVRLATMPLQLAWTLLDDFRHEVVKVAEQQWDDGTAE